MKHAPPTKRPPIRAPKKICGRTAVSNGRRLLLSNGSSLWGRRFADLCADHAQDLGGADTLTAAQIGLIRRVSALECELELRENKLAAGEEVDLDEFARVSGHCRRIWETLGLHRLRKDVTPTIADIVAKHASKPADHPSRLHARVAAQVAHDAKRDAGKPADGVRPFAAATVAPPCVSLASAPLALAAAPVSPSEPIEVAP